MRCGVIWSSAVRSDTCEVTRDIHRSSSTFISPKKPWWPGEMREHLVLVVELPAAGVQRGLVERRESDAVEAPRERQVDHVRERLAGDASGLRRDRAARDRARIEIAQVDDRHLVARPVDVLGCAVRAPRELDAGVARALLEHARVADHDEARGVGEAPVGEHARALLRADSGGSRRASGRAAGVRSQQASGR